MNQTNEELRAEILRLQNDLAGKAALLDLLFTHNPDGIAISDASFNVTANPVSAVVFGETRDDVKPDAWSEQYGIFGPDGVTPAPIENLPLVRALKNGETLSDELLFIRNAKRPGGTWISVAARPIPGGGAISTFRDVTDQKHLELNVAKRNAELAQREQENSELVERLRLAIDELSTPVLEVWKDVLAVPLVGVLDTQRSARMSERVLSAITERGARHVIVDVTGVELVDTATADQLIKLAVAIQLLGCECLVTGIQPAVAQTLVQLGVELRGFRTLPTLRRAIEHCMRVQHGHDGGSTPES